MKEFIEIKGARQHNLKNINLKIPKNKLVVFTGVSGSGKSSLAMDTLFAEGQRRYVESLSSYARQFLGMMDRPDVDGILGLSPAIAITQSAISPNPRSTVGTITEVYDYLRLLFARIGHPHCPKCNREISTQSAPQITKSILGFGRKAQIPKRGTRLLLLAPVVRDRKGEFRELFKNLRSKGFQRVRIDGTIFDLDEDFVLIKTNKHTIDVIVDRLVLEKKVSKETITRITDSVETALRLSDGLIIVSEVLDSSFEFPQKPKKMKDHLFSQKFACPECNISLPPVEPRTFSFNSPYGACPECNGLGKKLRIDPQKVPFWQLPRLEKRYLATKSDYVRQEIEKLMIKEVCPVCQGKRLKKDSLSITVEGRTIANVTALPIKKLFSWLQGLPGVLSEKELEIAQPIFKELNSRVSFLLSVGLDYLTLDREAGSLAAGEAQRIRLASQIGTSLSGVLYILDEPTIGLHQRDNQKLIKTLKELRNLGNTIVVIEHDREMIKNADWVVDFGPGAGKNGGRIVFSGKLKDLVKEKNSLTGRHLAGKEKIEIKGQSFENPSEFLTITGCSEHNLKNIKAFFPLGKLICVTGVSGSGKSTLVHDTLYHALASRFSSAYKEKPGKYQDVLGAEHIGRVLLVDQSPIGRTSRSNPATYISVFTDIRELFTNTPEARVRGYKKGRFSFNVPGGRCEECKGQGEIRIEMQFLPDVYVKCEVCQGKRYNSETLEVEYKGKNIAEVLGLTDEEALEFFKNIPQVVYKLGALRKIGLSYLELGQPSPTLSGGEAQRLKLARELVKKSTGTTLYLLDEPTVGLHFEDLKKLLLVLRELTAQGNTVVIIEHNPDIIKNCDFLIDLGPEGGDEGGWVIAQGTPGEITKVRESYTGRFLRKFLN